MVVAPWGRADSRVLLSEYSISKSAVAQKYRSNGASGADGEHQRKRFPKRAFGGLPSRVARVQACFEGLAKPGNQIFAQLRDPSLSNSGIVDKEDSPPILRHGTKILLGATL
jgi:hypothetical protein